MNRPNQHACLNPTVAWFMWGIPTHQHIISKGWFTNDRPIDIQMHMQRVQKYFDLV